MSDGYLEWCPDPTKVTAPNVVWLPLGELLVERGLLSRAQLTIALAEQRRAGLRLGAVLLAFGFVSETALARTLLEQVGLAAPALGTSGDSGELRLNAETAPVLAVARAEREQVRDAAGVADPDASGGESTSVPALAARVGELERLLSDFDERSRAIEEDITRLRSTLRLLRDERVDVAGVLANDD